MSGASGSKCTLSQIESQLVKRVLKNSYSVIVHIGTFISMLQILQEFLDLLMHPWSLADFQDGHRDGDTGGEGGRTCFVATQTAAVRC